MCLFLKNHHVTFGTHLLCLKIQLHSDARGLIIRSDSKDSSSSKLHILMVFMEVNLIGPVSESGGQAIIVFGLKGRGKKNLQNVFFFCKSDYTCVFAMMWQVHADLCLHVHLGDCKRCVCLQTLLFFPSVFLSSLGTSLTLRTIWKWTRPLPWNPFLYHTLESGQ